MLRYLRYLLWPFSVLYGAVIAIRNKGYDWQLFKSVKIELPVLVVGNLAVGGAGKSPMTEYLISLLSDQYKVATLSRGYGRRTKGFLYVATNDDVKKVGDEPLQFKNKFPAITVAVCENRVEGVLRLKSEHDVVILDDAFQHRALQPGFSILLFEYASLFQPKLMLPAGNFRDTFQQRKRADVIIVSKSPPQLSDDQKKEALQRLDAFHGQQVFFSFLKYGNPYPLFPLQEEMLVKVINKESSVLLVTGIVNPKPLLSHLREKVGKIVLLEYPDHHLYTKQDVIKISATLQSMEGNQKIIITTEKDAQRFKSSSIKASIEALPVIVIPVETVFNDADDDVLSERILAYCAEACRERGDCATQNRDQHHKNR